MVVLTYEMVQRGYCTHNQPQDLEHMRKLTHLQASGKDIEHVDDEIWRACRNLTVIYLYDNRLEKIPFFKAPSCGSITHLYLQNNAITRIVGLEALKSLQKLFLGGNKITVLEGLVACPLLEEIRIERQHLPPGHRLVFDPPTIAALSQSLQVLDISDNKIITVATLAVLNNLRELYCSNNQIDDFREIGGLLDSNWRFLECLDFSGNPICHRNKVITFLYVSTCINLCF